MIKRIITVIEFVFGLIIMIIFFPVFIEYVLKTYFEKEG